MRYTYTHFDCGGSVTKTPVGPKATIVLKKKSDKTDIDAPTLHWNGLHGWKCDKCGSRGCKIHRILEKEG